MYNVAPMVRNSPFERLKITSDHLIGGLLVLGSFLVFWLSPVHQVTDSAYSMLLSESLLSHHSFVLDSYAIPKSEVKDHWQLELVNDHIYYGYPAGSSLLSLPFVAIMNVFNLSAANADGTFNRQGEVKMEAIVAALLMAALTAILFFTGRLVLPSGWSFLIALGGAFGTQVWSTASRALWSHTWEITLLGVVIWMLLAAETGRHKLKPAALATLLAWAYFVRPTGAIPILAITVYIFIFHRRSLLPYAVTGSIWAIGLVAYSWLHFGNLLPKYFREPVPFKEFHIGLAGSLISPSRGLFVFVPVLFFVFYLLVRYWPWLVFQRLALLALSIVLVHLITISGSEMWWGGACFGPRLTTDLVPWFALLSVLGVQAMRAWRRDQTERRLVSWRAANVFGVVLLLCSVFLNGRGALSWETWLWYELPTHRNGNLLWDWRYPQFLAGLMRPPILRDFPLTQTHLDLSKPEVEKYLWYGWSAPEPGFRWTHGQEAAFVFALDEIGDTILQIKCGPFLQANIAEKQIVNIDLNGHRLTSLTLTEPGQTSYSVVMPRDFLNTRNVLLFSMPNAISPGSQNVGDDARVLGIAIEWIKFLKQESTEN